MMYVSIAVFLLMVLLNLLFKIASFFRLSIPLLYALAAPIIFPDWVQEQETLATFIFCRADFAGHPELDRYDSKEDPAQTERK